MNVLITGASRGIGFALTQQFIDHPQYRVLAISRNTEELNQLKEEHPNGDHLKVLRVDLSNSDLQDVFAVIQTWQQLDILINNAGSLIHRPFEEISLSEWRATFEVNFFSVVKLIHLLLPFLKKSKAAHIVNIGSMGGIQGSVKFSGMSAYSASKAALANLTECLAEELKISTVAVNCLCLGAVNTEMFQEAFPEFTAPIESDEMAAFIYHFATTSHRFFNGKVLPVSSSTP